MKYRFVLCLLLIFLLCGCSKNTDTEPTDDYLSLNDLLTTERSTENSTRESQTKEAVTEATTKEAVTEATAASEESTEDSDSDAKKTYVESIPSRTTASSEDSATEAKSDDSRDNPTSAAATESEKVIIYQYIEVPVVPNDYFFCDTWHHQDNTLVFSPRELYYSNGTLHATMYLYNGHNTTATNIHDIYLSFDNGTTAIAAANFDVLNGCSIAPGCYVLWDFTFPPNAVYLKNTDLRSINTTYESTYNY